MESQGRTTRRGATLIEVIIALAVIAIVAGIAYPLYMDIVRKARRLDAATGLLQIQLAQERYRAAHPRYARSLTELGWGAEPAPSAEGFYLLALAPVPDPAAGFRAEAVPSPGSDQARDPCRIIVLDQDGPDLAQSSAPGCWAR